MKPAENVRCFDFISSKRILVANDFSPAAISALIAGLRLAQRSQAELIVLNVEETPHSVPWGTRASTYLVEQEIHHHKICDRIKDMLAEHLMPVAQSHLPSVRVLAVDGDPATEIVKTAFDCKVDLIIVASHGHTGLKRLLLGDTAEKVARYASCSVLVVRQSKSELDLPPVKPPAELVG
jgi:nucleotide-binding universal stress UspA family protein